LVVEKEVAKRSSTLTPKKWEGSTNLEKNKTKLKKTPTTHSKEPTKHTTKRQ
jgi:hypothetical protein